MTPKRPLPVQGNGFALYTSTMFAEYGVINIWTFLAGTVAIILAPGPNSLYVLATGVRRGIKPGYKAACGVFLGDAALMFLAAVGAGSVLALYPVAFAAMQYAGAAYLSYVGIRILYAQLFVPAKSENTAPANEAPAENPFAKALLLSLSNPKAILFFVSFFVQFVDPAYAHTGVSFLILAGFVQLTSLTYLSLLIFGGAALSSFFRDHGRLARLSQGGVGALFLGFGCKLALSARL